MSTISTATRVTWKFAKMTFHIPPCTSLFDLHVAHTFCYTCKHFASSYTACLHIYEENHISPRGIRNVLKIKWFKWTHKDRTCDLQDEVTEDFPSPPTSLQQFGINLEKFWFYTKSKYKIVQNCKNSRNLSSTTPWSASIYHVFSLKSRQADEVTKCQSPSGFVRMSKIKSFVGLYCYVASP